MLAIPKHLPYPKLSTDIVVLDWALHCLDKVLTVRDVVAESPHMTEVDSLPIFGIRRVGTGIEYKSLQTIAHDLSNSVEVSPAAIAIFIRGFSIDDAGYCYSGMYLRETPNRPRYACVGTLGAIAMNTWIYNRGVVAISKRDLRLRGFGAGGDGIVRASILRESH